MTILKGFILSDSPALVWYGVRKIFLYQTSVLSLGFTWFVGVKQRLKSNRVWAELGLIPVFYLELYDLILVPDIHSGTLAPLLRGTTFLRTKPTLANVPLSAAFLIFLMCAPSASALALFIESENSEYMLTTSTSLSSLYCW